MRNAAHVTKEEIRSDDYFPLSLCPWVSTPMALRVSRLQHTCQWWERGGLGLRSLPPTFSSFPLIQLFSAAASGGQPPALWAAASFQQRGGSSPELGLVLLLEGPLSLILGTSCLLALKHPKLTGLLASTSVGRRLNRITVRVTLSNYFMLPKECFTIKIIVCSR